MAPMDLGDHFTGSNVFSAANSVVVRAVTVNSKLSNTSTRRSNVLLDMVRPKRLGRNSHSFSAVVDPWGRTGRGGALSRKGPNLRANCWLTRTTGSLSGSSFIYRPSLLTEQGYPRLVMVFSDVTELIRS
ncbi:hypothetical protein AWB76_02431 [Caballeronia temeraria]|uniref:Uncharacterized protein n=1 Tax=Caballeronia temeraria TaxID=1777137 RepID=A0A158AHD3_9BURK|nr:hypothetical protein AWB76_02431 [Caballeronia temeraria]